MSGIARSPTMHCPVFESYITKHLVESLTDRSNSSIFMKIARVSLSPQPVYMKIKHFYDWIAAAMAAIILQPLNGCGLPW